MKQALDVPQCVIAVSVVTSVNFSVESENRKLPSCIHHHRNNTVNTCECCSSKLFKSEGADHVSQIMFGILRKLSGESQESMESPSTNTKETPIKELDSKKGKRNRSGNAPSSHKKKRLMRSNNATDDLSQEEEDGELHESSDEECMEGLQQSPESESTDKVSGLPPETPQSETL